MFEILKNFDLLFLGIIIAAIGILGFGVFSNNRQSITNRTFLLFSLVTIVWGIFNYISYQVRSPVLVLWFLRLVIFTAVWHAFSFFQLFYVFPNEKMLFPKKYIYLVTPLVALVSIFTLTPFIFSEIKELSPAGQASIAVVGLGIIVFGVTVVSLIGFGIFLLFRKTYKAKKEDRSPFRYLLVGTLLTFSLIITFNFLLPVLFNNVRFIPLGAAFIFPFVAFAFYAIVRHHLLNIKVVSTEIIVFVLTISAFFEVIFTSDFILLLFRSSIFILLLIFGIFLIRSVRREIEQRERLETLSKELSRANQELKKLDQAKSEFISIASHQLRAPLTIIKGYLSMLLEGSLGRAPKLVQEKMQTVFFSADQMVKLVGDLLNLSRIESGKIKYAFEMLDLIPLVTGIIQELSGHATKKKISVGFANETSSSLSFLFDKDKMREVVINLLDNAIKYSRESGHVVVGIKNVAANRVRLNVTDDGMGIKPDDIKKLFTKFSRMEEATRSDPNGMGIGLYFVKRVVEDHGGSVGVESEGLGKGSTFFVELPLDKAISKS